MGIKRYCIDVAIVPCQGAHLLPSLYVPNLDGLVPTARSQPAAVRAKGNAGNVALMTGQGTDLTAASDVPKLYALIRTRGGQIAAVRTESRGINILLVTAQGPYFFISFPVATSQILIVFSSPPEASQPPSGLKAT